MDESDKESILAAIAHEEERLKKLTHEQEQVLSRIQILRDKLISHEAIGNVRELPAECFKTSLIPKNSTEKVVLFRSLFRGREDIFPRLWMSRAGKKGYAPACLNDWAAGVCGKTCTAPVKCGECSNRKFLPVTDQAILDHLQGRHVIGIYPMLENDTCWFLAADFDKESWMEDVHAFRKTCRSMDIPIAIERSRSGNGAHVWFFFTEPISAAVARAMGCFLITETMSNRHQLSMESYDRLFPSQDMLPKGGFGNLIALPLQHESRQKGNTVFLDQDFKPYEDQWNFLASLRRIMPVTAHQIASDAIQRGKVIGIPRGITEDEGDSTPWNRSPSRKTIKEMISGILPEKIHVVVSQQIFVEKKDLSSPLINRIKRLAAFQNPEFYKKQNLRLSTALTPRVITCFEELPDHLALPRGCMDDLKDLLSDHKIKIQIDDERSAGEVLEFTFKGELTEPQKTAAKEVLKNDTGVMVAPPGFGKTVLGAYVIAQRKRSTLILVHRKPLLEQWINQISLFLGINPKEIGEIGAGKNKPTGKIDVAMIQSLVRKGEVRDLVAQYGQVVIDECHHLPAVSFERVLNEVKARYVLGLTATPYRRDGHQPIIHMQCGPVRYAVHPKNSASNRHFDHRLILRMTDFELNNPEVTIQEIFTAVMADKNRNALIVADVRKALREGRTPLLLTERKEHLEILAAELKHDVRHLVVLSGRLSAKERQETMKRLETIAEGEERLIMATGRYIGEGFDDPRLDTLFLVMPFSWKGTIVQYAGRLHRIHPGKTEVRVFDYVDTKVLKLLRMHKKRLKGFESMGYQME